MKRIWFKPWGWIYYPISWEGVVVTALAALFCLHIFMAVDRRSHSGSDTLYGIFPYWVPTFGVWLWVGSRTSK